MEYKTKPTANFTGKTYQFVKRKECERKDVLPVSRNVTYVIEINGEKRIHERKNPQGKATETSTNSSKNQKAPDNRNLRQMPYNRYALKIPALKYLMNFNQRRFMQWFWAISILCYGIACLCQIISCCREFYYGEPSIQMEIKHTNILPVPAVTFCPFNLYEDNPYSRKLKKEYQAIFGHDREVSFSDLLHLPNMTVMKLWNIYKMEARNLIVDLQCSIKKDDSSCSDKFDVSTIFTIKGICALIRPSSYVTINGPITSLTFSYNTSTANMFSPSAMFTRVDAFNPDEDPTYFGLNSGSSLFSKMVVRATVKIIQVIKVNHPNKPCASSKEVNICTKNCIEKAISLKADCRLPFMKQDLPNCETAKDLNRTLQIALKTLRMENSVCDCPRKCNEFIFTLFGDLDNLSSQSASSINLTSYFSDLEIQVIREVFRYKAAHLISDVASALGFYLGFCFLHSFELLEAIIRKLCYK